MARYAVEVGMMCYTLAVGMKLGVIVILSLRRISSLAVGEIIPAGSMIAVADKVGTIVKSTDTEAFASVVGLTKNDIVKEEGKNIGTATIVVEGVVIAERIDVPAEVQKALTRITFE